MRILITGPIGSGKTTQARILSQELGLKLIKIGELLRDRMDHNPKIKEAMMKGDMVDDSVVAEVVKEEMAGRKDFIFDGFPRHLSQLQVLDPKIDMVIYIKIPDDEVHKRLSQRGRADDKPEIIEERLKVYHEEINPLLDYYRKQNKLAEVDGMGTENDIKDRIKKIFF